MKVSEYIAIQPSRPFHALYESEYEILMKDSSGYVFTIGSDIPLKGHELDDIEFLEYVKPSQHELDAIAKMTASSLGGE